MPESREVAPNVHTTSQGHAVSDAAWLDTHFETKRVEYTAMLAAVGLQTGWHVLDAGCGSGGYLPLIAEAIGATGRIVALDLAPENVMAVQARLPQWALACPVDTKVGNVLALPFPEGHFDAVFFANTAQYLTDDEFSAALQEFRRVVRPGGLVAIKEADGTHCNMAPGDPARMWRLLAATRQTARQIHGILRAPGLRRWLERAGLEAVWQRTTIIERWTPLRPVERQFIGELYVWYSGLAENATLSEEDRAFWRVLRDPAAKDHPMQQEDFSYYDGQVVAVGRVPMP